MRVSSFDCAAYNSTGSVLFELDFCDLLRILVVIHRGATEQCWRHCYSLSSNGMSIVGTESLTIYSAVLLYKFVAFW